MAIRNIFRGKTPVGNATGSSAPIYVDSDDNKLKMIPAGSGSTEVEVVDASSAQTLTNKTLTSPAVTGPAEVLAAADVLTAADAGKTIFLNSATEFAVTLPAAALGLRFTFIVTAAPSGASYTIVTPGAPDQIIFGHVLTSGFNDSPADIETSGGATTITFVDGIAAVGDRVDLECDGTNWYAVATCAVEAGITFTG